MKQRLLSLFFINRIGTLSAAVLAAFFLCSCASSSPSSDTRSIPDSDTPKTESSDSSNEEENLPREKGSRDNTPVCLVPEAPGVTVYENEYAHLDASNISEGYLTVKYTGSSGKVKLQITGPTEITYTYNLTVTTPTDEVFPLQSGNGQYIVNVFENLEGTKYTTVFSQMLDVQLSDEFKPFLYPNQYVTFSKDSQAVAKGQDLAYVCNNELEVVSEVYNFMIKNITYDYEEAETVQSGYIPDIDEVLSTKKGICLDYAALMTSMLRSQQIPTRMEIGYAGTAYHAWLSTYITDIGWVNGMIEFDGKEWSLMDPTFASNTDDKSLKDFIGDGKNYSVKYVY
ncbi:Transglutaminase-like superfamily protein [Butyrivibrio sp. YAB3001]|nr:Transglutaminase-like superfamily protein [Butyrivibrio sp. YAB3001]